MPFRNAESVSESRHREEFGEETEDECSRVGGVGVVFRVVKK